MNLNEKSKEMLDRYIIDTARRLPGKNRKEIALEIRSTILDMLEDKYEGYPDMAQTQALEEILKQMGNPSKIARSYLPDKYLVGPMIYPFFKKIWTVIWAIISIILAVRLMLIISESPNGKAIFEFAGTALNSFIISFGILVFIFFILEKFNTFDEFKEEEEKWKPSDLPEIENGVVKIGEEIASIVFLVVAIIVFNTYLRNFSLFFIENGSWDSLTAEHNNLLPFIPFLTGIWICEIIFHFSTIKFGIKKYFTFLSKIAIFSANSVTAAIMLYCHSRNQMISMDETQSLSSLNPVINIITYIFLLAILIPNIAGIITGIYYSLKTRNIL